MLIRHLHIFFDDCLCKSVAYFLLFFSILLLFYGLFFSNSRYKYFLNTLLKCCSLNIVVYVTYLNPKLFLLFTPFVDNEELAYATSVTWRGDSKGRQTTDLGAVGILTQYSLLAQDCCHLTVSEAKNVNFLSHSVQSQTPVLCL